MRVRSRRRDSLRWRLPAFLGGLVVLVLATFVWATYREVESTLVAKGVERADSGAEEMATMLSRAVHNALTQTAQLAADPVVRAFLREPTQENREAALAVLRAGSAGLRRIEVWDEASTPLLVHTAPSTMPDTALALRAYPAGDRPGAAGMSRLLTAAEFAYVHFTAEVVDTTERGIVRLGHVRRFGQFSSPGAGGTTLRRLLGDDAIIKIGSTDGVWADLDTVVSSPPARVPRVVGTFRTPDRRRWIAGEAAIDGSPLQVWVGHPYNLIVAPARVFLRNMLVLALLFVIASVVLAAALGSRLVRALHALAGAAEEIAAGDYSRRVQADRRDEIGRVGVAFNRMTDRIEEAHRELRESHEHTQFALAAGRVGVWESQLEGGRIRCSDSMRFVLGVDAAHLPATLDAFLVHVHEEDRAAVRESLEGRTNERHAFDMRFRIVTAEQSIRWIEGKARIRFDRDAEPVSVLGTSVDVTERYRLEMQLRQSQKMDAIGQLAGGVAHDFNNLLTAIVGHGNIVLAELPSDSAVRDDVIAILNAGESAASLTRQLLTFSRHQPVTPQVVAVNELVTQTDRLIRRLIDADIGVASDLAAEVDTVRIDPGQLEQVVVNLVINARDAMPGGGRLTIATRNVDFAANHMLEEAGVQPGAYLLLAVSDTGIGMDAQTQSRIFEPFFTTKAAGHGTGLGLATVFGIVKQSGGHIFVYSEPGHGTTFKIYLPVCAEPASKICPRGATPAITGGGESILVVEDDAAVRSVARSILKRVGYRVTVAESAEHALQILAKGYTPDLVISDVVMPGMTGPELAREIAVRHPRLPIIFASGYTGDALARHGMQIATGAFIEKPYSPAVLTRIVRDALDAASAPIARAG